MSHLGSFSPEALEAFQNAVAGDSPEFAEGETYDFTRCVRADGSHYGTGGTCRKGTETGEKDSKDALSKVKIVSAETAKKMSDAELKSQMDNANKAAFSKGANLSPEVMKGLKEQHDIARAELAKREKGREVAVKALKEQIAKTPGETERKFMIEALQILESAKSKAEKG